MHKVCFGMHDVCDLTFVKNEFQKFENVPVRYISHESEMFGRMLKDIEDGNGFTVPCNSLDAACRHMPQSVGPPGVKSTLASVGPPKSNVTPPTRLIRLRWGSLSS